MADLPLFPLPETVVFPGMTIPLYIFEDRYKQMIKDCVQHDQKNIVIVLASAIESIRDHGPATSDVGTITELISVSENTDGTYNIIVHGKSRIEVGDIDAQSHPYYSIADRTMPLDRGDPNLERVAAWDALDTFREYAQAFFASEAREQIEGAIPDDLMYQASFICANIRVPATSRQMLLEAKSLTVRFQLAQKLMLEQLAKR